VKEGREERERRGEGKAAKCTREANSIEIKKGKEVGKAIEGLNAVQHSYGKFS